MILDVVYRVRAKIFVCEEVIGLVSKKKRSSSD
jgi:hypothetical protein